MLLAGCGDKAPPPPPEAAAPPAPAAAPIAVAAPADEPLSISGDGAKARQPVGGVFRGTGRFVKAGKPNVAAGIAPGGDITFHFINASIADVARAVLGDTLKLDYVISPNVQGTVTLQTAHPIAHEAVLPALQAAFRMAGAAVIEVDGAWRVVPLADAPRQGELVSPEVLERAKLPGFGMQVVALRYVSADEMQHLLEPIVPQGSIVRVDQARNLLILGGSPQEIDAMREQIATFDVDWLAGMSFALVPLKIADAKSVADELQDVVGREHSPIGNLVHIVPIERMNAVLLISPQLAYLEELKTWADRFDRGSEKDDVKLYVYPVQNGRAADLASVLHKIFGGGSDSGGSNGPAPISTASHDFSGGSFGTGGSTGSGLGSTAGGSSAPQTAAGASASGGGSPVNSGLRPERSQAGGGNGLLSGTTGPQITADEVNNALLILATAHDYGIIEAALKQLDKWPLQVAIEASIAEVTLTDQLQYGVQYFLQKGKFGLLDTAEQSVTPSIPVPGYAMLFTSGSNQVILSALQSVTKVNTISAPRMMVLNNQTATLQVGDQVPVQTQSATNVVTSASTIVTSVDYRDTGVIVKLTPRVNDSGLVLLDISQEVSDVTTTTSSSLNSPTFTERRFTSSIAVRDGETVALGGLISDSINNSDGGIPVVRDIPVVGHLFDNVSKNKTRTELLVLLTPHIIRTEQDSRTMTDEFRRRMKAIEPVERRIQ
jgi:general secretion pathway protein D